MSMDAIESISDYPSIAYTEARSCSLKRKPFLYCDLTRRLCMHGCRRDEAPIQCAGGKENGLNDCCSKQIKCEGGLGTEIIRGWPTGRCPSICPAHQDLEPGKT